MGYHISVLLPVHESSIYQLGNLYLYPPCKEQVEIVVAQQLDMPISDRFTPHVTIAKKRKTSDKVIIQKENFEPIEIPVQSFSLFSVHPEKSPKYESIETFQLNSQDMHSR